MREIKNRREREKSKREKTVIKNNKIYTIFV